MELPLFLLWILIEKTSYSHPDSPVPNVVTLYKSWNLRFFSFNNPAGACKLCDGLGIQQFFDPSHVVAHPELSLAGEQYPGWDRRISIIFRCLVRSQFIINFALDKPFSSLPEHAQRVVLGGSGEEEIQFSLH